MTQWTVWKYEIFPNEYAEFDVPTGASFLAAAEQSHGFVVWALCNPETKTTERRRVRMVHTGEEFREMHASRLAPHYIATITDSHGYVYHVFEERGEV